MPKFTYSASRGIEQSNGSGFVINDVSITEGSASIGDGEPANPYGVNVCAVSATLVDGETEGQKATFVMTAGGNITGDSVNLVGIGAGVVVVLLWNGSAWIRVSA